MKLMRPWIGSCQETEACMSDHLEAALPATDERRVRRHLLVCSRCRAIFASLTRVVTGVRDLASSEPERPSSADAVLDRLRGDRR